MLLLGKHSGWPVASSLDTEHDVLIVRNKSPQQMGPVKWRCISQTALVQENYPVTDKQLYWPITNVVVVVLAESSYILQLIAVAVLDGLLHTSYWVFALEMGNLITSDILVSTSVQLSRHTPSGSLPRKSNNIFQLAIPICLVYHERLFKEPTILPGVRIWLALAMLAIGWKCWPDEPFD